LKLGVHRDLLLLSAALLTWGIGEGMFFYFQPLYLQQLGADPLMIGSILGGVGLAMTVVHLPAGYLSDRIGRRQLLYAAWIVGTLAAWIMALSRTLPFFVAGSILYGFTNFVLVPLNSYITVSRGNWSVGRTLTLVSAAFNLGAVLGPLLGGWIGAQFGLERTYLVAACIFILSTLLVFFIRAQPVDSDPGISQNGLKAVLTPRFVRYMGILFFVMFTVYLPQPLSQNFLQNERGLDLAQIGTLLSTASLGVVTFNLVLGHLNARVGFIFAQIAMALFALLLWSGEALPWFFMAYFLLGSYRTLRSLGIAQSRALSHGSNMGIAYGLIETAASLAIIFAPPLAGWLYAREPLSIYPVSLGLMAFAMILTLFFMPLRRQDVI
jgi:MFS family permease